MMTNPLLEQLYGMRHQLRHLTADVDAMISVVEEAHVVEAQPDAPVDDSADDRKPPTFGSRRHGTREEIEKA